MKRYRLPTGHGVGLVESSVGDWVRHDDVAELEAKNVRATHALLHAFNLLQDNDIEGLHTHLNTVLQPDQEDSGEVKVSGVPYKVSRDSFTHSGDPNILDEDDLP